MLTRVLKWWLFVIFGFYLFGILTILPLPMEWQWLRPQWLLLFVIFCQLNQPKYFNVWTAWLIGLLLDTLFGTPLGQNAFIFALICYLTSFYRNNLLQKPLALQLIKITMLLCLAQGLSLWFHAMVGQKPFSWLYWSTALTSALIWPLMVFFLQMLSRTFKIVLFSTRSI